MSGADGLQLRHARVFETYFTTRVREQRLKTVQTFRKAIDKVRKVPADQRERSKRRMTQVLNHLIGQLQKELFALDARHRCPGCKGLVHPDSEMVQDDVCENCVSVAHEMLVKKNTAWYEAEIRDPEHMCDLAREHVIAHPEINWSLELARSICATTKEETAAAAAVDA